ncbi:AMP-binding protein [Actibacterium sp. D379-3]
MRQTLPLTSPEKIREYRENGYWQDVNLVEKFMAAADRLPEKIAIIEGERRLTYGAMRQTVDNIAGNLIELGMEPGQVVALQSRNCAEFMILHMAAQRIGCLYMPLHDSWRHTEVRHLLNQAQARVLITPGIYRDFDYAAMIDELRPDLPHLAHVFRLDGASDGFAAFADLCRPSPIDPQALDARMPDPDAPGAIMLSGGTTSLSKISRYSSNNLLNMFNAFSDAVEFQESDIAAALAPGGTGATGYIYPMLMPILHGATAVILQKWGDPEEAIDLILRENCTYAVGIPTQLTRMLPGLEKRSSDDFSSFRAFTNAGAPLAYDTAAKIEALMGCRVQTIYGATDGGTPTMTRLTDPDDKRLGTVGKVMPGQECDLRDSAGVPVPLGEVGEVYWRGPDKSWGYLGDEAATEAAFTQDNFYKSGDLGQFDPDGYLRIVGRVRDMILRGGRNISPRTVEELMVKHPAILEVAVAAMPDPELGERACAFAVLRSGGALSFDDMIGFLKQHNLAVWQLPERLELMAELPKSTGGKIKKDELTRHVTEKLRAEAGTSA